MPPVRISMRWWLGVTLAAVVALTAFSVAEVFNHRAAGALRQRAEDLAVGQSVSAAQSTAKALDNGILATAAGVIAERRRFSLYVFSPDGQELTQEGSRGVAFSGVPNGQRALRSALRGERYVDSRAAGSAFVVGLQLPGDRGAIVTYTQRPELLGELGIVHDQIVNAALVAVAVGGAVGLLIALVLAARLRRIARSAARIADGAFDEPLHTPFADEVGALAETIDLMRERLRESFGRLGEERDRLQQLLEGLEDGVVAVDSELRITFANTAAQRLLQGHALSIDEPLTDPWPDFPLRSFAQRLFEEADRPHQARVVEHERTFALVGIPARPETDAILVIRDISERERRERAEREFIANAAHELGSPLTAITTSLEVLQAGAKTDPAERDRFLALIERQTLRLSRLRRALLTLARAQTRQEALQLQPVTAGTLLSGVAAELEASSHEAGIVVDAPEELTLLAHPELIEQVVLNLAENALQHGSATQVELVARAVQGHLATIEVRDNGTGIPAAERDRLFDRFYRGSRSRDSEGFGLGLAIAREAVRALGGTIAIETPPGKGTVVRITLARAEAPVA